MSHTGFELMWPNQPPNPKRFSRRASSHGRACWPWLPRSSQLSIGVILTDIDVWIHVAGSWTQFLCIPVPPQNPSMLIFFLGMYLVRFNDQAEVFNGYLGPDVRVRIWNYMQSEFVISLGAFRFPPFFWITKVTKFIFYLVHEWTKQPKNKSLILRTLHLT